MNKRIGAVSLLVGTMLIVSGAVMAAADKKQMDKQTESKKGATAGTDDIFWVFKDRGNHLNHYIPSGWMGDFGDLKFNPGWPKNAQAGKKGEKKPVAGPDQDTAMQIIYSAERKQGAGWAGIYWQHPANNWGDKRGGFDLSKYSKLKFMAKGEKGKETIDKFFIGGITGQTEEGDSDEASVSPVELTKDWKEYTIDLVGLDMSHIIGGFGFAANADSNPEGFTMYIDDVRLVK